MVIEDIVCDNKRDNKCSGGQRNDLSYINDYTLFVSGGINILLGYLTVKYGNCDSGSFNSQMALPLILSSGIGLCSAVKNIKKYVSEDCESVGYNLVKGITSHMVVGVTSYYVSFMNYSFFN